MILEFKEEIALTEDLLIFESSLKCLFIEAVSYKRCDLTV